jgi:hypothetical protein
MQAAPRRHEVHRNLETAADRYFPLEAFRDRAGAEGPLLTVLLFLTELALTVISFSNRSYCTDISH